jgi:hypothetical protein
MNRKLNNALLAALTAGLVAACGGGGGSDNPPTTTPPPARQAPQILGLADQMLPQDTSTPVLTFQVSDSDSGAASVVLTAISSDTNLIPAEGMVLGGSGANRTMQITPAAEAFGETMLTIRATDPDGLTAQQSIRIQVNGVFVSFLGTVNDVFPIEENGEQRALTGFTFTQDVDDDPTAFDTLL